MSRAGRGEHWCLCITAPVGTSEPLGNILSRSRLCQFHKDLVFHQTLVLMSHDGMIGIAGTRSNRDSRLHLVLENDIVFLLTRPSGEALPHRLVCTSGKGNPDRCWRGSASFLHKFDMCRATNGNLRWPRSCCWMVGVLGNASECRILRRVTYGLIRRQEEVGCNDREVDGLSLRIHRVDG
ncbi:hypothetical protein GQ607_006965 [Colletotrichum asianum]|uniref:Uncharacterized protein n=1 Tax=Colletotrichum asianum TaxID=702518 RepID=A0A8H3WJZ0_9PEZI|nr:hypothetical protein GQ607_006965 [Colletotrichum asianum]